MRISYLKKLGFHVHVETLARVHSCIIINQNGAGRLYIQSNLSCMNNKILLETHTIKLYNNRKLELFV
jgi:hypothetical protein